MAREYFELVGSETIINNIVDRKFQKKKKPHIYYLKIEWELPNRELAYTWEPERMIYLQVPSLVRQYFEEHNIKDRYIKRRVYDKIVKVWKWIPSKDMYYVRLENNTNIWLSKKSLMLNNPEALKNVPRFL